MEEKLTWEEMKKRFPDEWLLIGDMQLNEHQQLLKGIVLQHSPTKSDIFTLPAKSGPTAFRYTGESTFSGLRSHVEHPNSL